MISELGKCWTAVIFLGSYNFLLTILLFNYKLKWDKWKIKIEHSEYQQQKKIKILEDKNGHEQHQLDEHKEEIKELKKDKGELKDQIIKLQGRIINCEKNNGHASETPKRNIPTPPPPPPAPKRTEQKPRQEQEKSPRQKHEEHLKRELEKRRKKIEGEENNKN